jgi:hypothetical protein
VNQPLTLIDAPASGRLLPPAPPAPPALPAPALPAPALQALPAAPARPAPQAPTMPSACQPIARIRGQAPAAVRGTIRSAGTINVGSGPAFHFTLVDDSGELDVLFLGWREISGLLPGSRVTVEGRVGTYHRKPALWNPRYKIEATG